MKPAERFPPSTDSLDATVRHLRIAGWLIGDLEARSRDGWSHWLVCGSNGKNLIRADAPTQAEAWRAAEEQARALGLLGGPRPALTGNR